MARRTRASRIACSIAGPPLRTALRDAKHGLRWPFPAVVAGLGGARGERTGCAGLRVGGAPLDEVLVLGEHAVNQLVQHVRRVFTGEGCVSVERFVVLAVQARAVLHELLA